MSTSSDKKRALPSKPLQSSSLGSVSAAQSVTLSKGPGSGACVATHGAQATASKSGSPDDLQQQGGATEQGLPQQNGGAGCAKRARAVPSSHQEMAHKLQSILQGLERRVAGNGGEGGAGFPGRAIVH